MPENSAQENQSQQSKGLPINVPFAEKDEAKSLGAKWNPDIKKWCIPEGVDHSQFAKWM